MSAIALSIVTLIYLLNVRSKAQLMNSKIVDESVSGTLRIGTRKSDLALVQAHSVKGLLKCAFPNLCVEIHTVNSVLGDRVQNVSLKSLAVKSPGIFTKELENGLLEEKYDMVVHSLKDMPTILPNGLALAAITERENPNDALVVHAKFLGKGGLSSLPKGSVLGTSSVRREAMLRRAYPHLEVKLIRGNVNTRLSKLDSGEFDAIILAVAGLVRLGSEFSSRIEQVLNPPEFMYGVGQGALGLQCRSDDATTKRLVFLAANDENTAARCTAERALLRALHGGCQVPLGVVSDIKNNLLTLKCTILAEDGSQEVKKSITGLKTAPECIGDDLAKSLLSGVGKSILDRFLHNQTLMDGQRPITYGSAEEPNVFARPIISAKVL